MKKTILTIIHNKIVVLFGYYCLVLLGALFFVSFFYINFLRLRLPREIPFNLTDFSLYLLFFIIFFYLYSLYRLHFPKLLNLILQKLLNLISKPFFYFHNHFIYSHYIYPYFYKFSEKIIPKLENLNLYDRLLIIYFFSILPRLILLIIFATDVFYVNKIEIFYYFIFLGIFPLTYIFFKYLLVSIYDHHINMLEIKYDSILLYEKGNWEEVCFDEDDKEALGSKHNPNALYHEEFVSIRQYILINHERLQKYKPDDEKNNFQYEARPFAHKHIFDEHRKKYNKIDENLTHEDFVILHTLFNFLMPKIAILHNYFELSKDDEKHKSIKNLKTFIYLLYLLCWTYILIKSYPTLPFPFAQTLFSLFSSLPFLEEPFSGQRIIFF